MINYKVTFQQDLWYCDFLEDIVISFKEEIDSKGHSLNSIAFITNANTIYFWKMIPVDLVHGRIVQMLFTITHMHFL